MKKRVPVLAVALLAVGIGAALLWQQWNALRSEKTSLQARLAVLEAGQRGGAGIHAQMRDAGPAASTGAPRDSASGVAPDVASSGPTRAGRHASLLDTYPDLGHELGMTPDELDQFIDLLVNLQISQGPGGSPEQARVDHAAIDAFLGTRAAQWREYQNTLGERAQINQLRAELAADGMALPDAQGRPLLAALSAERKRVVQEWIKLRGPVGATAQERRRQSMQYTELANRRAVEVAKHHLDTRQVEIYRRMLEQQAGFTREMLLGDEGTPGPAAPRN